MHFVESGNGPVLLLLHNGGTDHRIWHYQLKCLSDRYRVIAVDLPGHGGTAGGDVPGTRDLYVREVERFLDERRIEGFAVAGNCVGAAVALELARRHPDRIWALVLFNVFAGRASFRKGLLANLPDTRASYALIAVIGLLQRRFRAPRALMIRFLYGDAVPTRADPVYAHLLTLSDRPQQTRLRRSLVQGMDSFALDLSEPAPRGLPPTLLIWGASNRTMSVARGEEFRQWLKPSRWVAIPEAGHLVMAERPEAVNAEIADFLAYVARK